MNDPRDPDESRADADGAPTESAIRDHDAGVQWPTTSHAGSPVAPGQPASGTGRPAPQRGGPPWQQTELYPSSATPPSPYPPAPVEPAPRPSSVWRSVGIGLLGFVGGVLLSLIVQDVLATALVRGGDVPIALSTVLGFLVPVFGVLGVVVACLIDHRNVKRRSTGRTR